MFDYQNPNIDPLNHVTGTGGHSQLLLLLGFHLLLLPLLMPKESRSPPPPPTQPQESLANHSGGDSSLQLRIETGKFVN